AAEVEIVAVAGAAQLKINFVRRASRSVVGIAADTFGRAIFGRQCAPTAPAARKFGKGAVGGRSRQRRHGDRRNQGAGGKGRTGQYAEKLGSQRAAPFS